MKFGTNNFLIKHPIEQSEMDIFFVPLWMNRVQNEQRE